MSEPTATEKAVHVYLQLAQRVHPDDELKFYEISKKYISQTLPMGQAFDAIPTEDRKKMFIEFTKLRYRKGL